MKKHLLSVFVALFVAFGTTWAQQPFFSTEKNAFYDQLSNYLNSSTVKQEKEEAIVIMKGFSGVWNSYYTDNEATTIIQLCELFHSKGGRAYANIFNFVEILQTLPTAGFTHRDVGNWLTYTEAKAKKSMNGMDKYLASCRSIFIDKVLSAKGNSKWLLRDALWSFPSSLSFELIVDGTLVLASQNDESVIRNTKGIYRVENNSWEGSGGRADWSRFGIPVDQAYIVFPDYYTLDLNRSEYSVDSVIFNEKKYFQQDILGRFEDKVLVNAPNEKTMYPRVKSYRSDFVIPNILKNVDFEGGVGMMGNQVEVFGGVRDKAVFKFNRNRREVVSVEAARFVMSKEEVLVTDHASMRLYLYDTISGSLEVDSIYHNNLGFRYDNKTRNMMIFRSEKDYGDAPYHDSYHGMDLFLEAMYWNTDSPTIDFKRMEGVNPRSEGHLVSMNYFRNDDFKRLQGLDGTHPMIRLEGFLNGFDNVERQVRFYVGDLATYLRYPTEQVLSLVLRLQAEGYVEYDSNSKWVTVLPRFFDVLESYRQNIDFDVIRLNTVTTGKQPNLRLDMRNNEMLVYGLTTQIDGIDGSAIILSDRKQVVVIPDNNRIILKKNRDFSFSGGVMAGMFEFFTKDCLFSYKDFMIKMNKVDSLRFYARDDKQVIPVNGTLERLHGQLMIDRGDNKSSREETPQYPIFNSDARSYKFYRNINGGVFDPGVLDTVVTAEKLEGKFYYYLHPFVVDSLNDLSMRQVKFDGELVSGGIFPTFEEPLVVMDDYSLGFVHQIGANNGDSYPMFGDLGRFHQKVYLSESGFYGDGQLDYQTSEFASEQFLFYPDSVMAYTNQFKMVPREDGTLFPVASAEALKLKWDVKKPELVTETMDNPICLYGDTYFTGQTSLSPQGYSADGTLRFGLTEFDSDHFAFDAHTFMADSANFMLYGADSVNIAFSATNYRANVDFDSQKVRYDYLDKNSTLDFPMNRFVCSLKEAEWDMATNSLHVFNPVESFGDYATATTKQELLAVHSNASKFVSLIPEQDSLQFYSMRAEYDMTNYVIHAHDVKIIRVADAAVFPYMHDVDINTDSKLEPVRGELLADTLNGYHLYKDAVVNIHSRNQYDAQGYWDYTNVEGISTPIRVDTIIPINGVTHGYAHIDDSLGFRLSTQFGFKGKLTLTATDKFGYYDGQFALLAFEESEDTIAALNHWFVSSTYIDPNAIRIPVDMGRIRDKEPKMCNGLYYELAIDGGYFASFLTPKEKRAEALDEVVPIQGLLSFDEGSKRFVVTDTTSYDTYLELNAQGIVKGYGSSGLGFDTPLTEFLFHGNYTQYPNDSLTLNGLNIINAPVFDDKIMEAMAEVYSMAAGESIDLTQTPYLHYFRSENDEAKTEERRMSIELEGYPKIDQNDFYNKTIVIPDLKMVWNSQLRAFVSVGKIGLGSLGKNVVNKYVDGYVVFDRRLGNITYYFKDEFFMTYINYNCGDGQLQVHATYGDINQRLYDTKERNRTVTQDGKQFQYVAVPYESMLDFLNRLRYAGIE